MGLNTSGVDSDGNFEVLIPYMIDAGITGIWPLEQAAGMDPVELGKKYGKDLVLLGGIDKRELTKDKSAIEKSFIAKSPIYWNKGATYLIWTIPSLLIYLTRTLFTICN